MKIVLNLPSTIAILVTIVLVVLLYIWPKETLGRQQYFLVFGKRSKSGNLNDQNMPKRNIKHRNKKEIEVKDKNLNQESQVIDNSLVINQYNNPIKEKNHSIITCTDLSDYFSKKERKALNKKNGSIKDNGNSKKSKKEMILTQRMNNKENSQKQIEENKPIVEKNILDELTYQKSSSAMKLGFDSQTAIDKNISIRENQKIQ